MVERGAERRGQLTWTPVHFEFGIRELVMNNANVRRAFANRLEIESAPVKRRFRVRGLTLTLKRETTTMTTIGWVLCSGSLERYSPPCGSRRPAG